MRAPFLCLTWARRSSAQVSPEKRRCAVGSILSEGEESPCPELLQLYQKFGFKVFSFPAPSHVVTATFPYTTTLSIWLATRRVHPALDTYIKVSQARVCVWGCGWEGARGCSQGGLSRLGQGSSVGRLHGALVGQVPGGWGHGQRPPASLPEARGPRLECGPQSILYGHRERVQKPGPTSSALAGTRDVLSGSTPHQTRTDGRAHPAPLYWRPAEHGPEAPGGWWAPGVRAVAVVLPLHGLTYLGPESRLGGGGRPHALPPASGLAAPQPPARRSRRADHPGT